MTRRWSLSVCLLLALTTPLTADVFITPLGTNFTVTITAAETVAIDCSGGFVRVTVDAAPVVTPTPCATVTSLSVTASGAFGNFIDLSAITSVDFPALTSVMLDGGEGVNTLRGTDLADSILGGDDADFISGNGGNDTIDGGNGSDTITGGPGDDTVLLSDGNDFFEWDAGDGSDTLDGGVGTDILNFLASAANETFTINANGTRIELLVDIGPIDMDLATMETINLYARDGDDTVIVNNLAGVPDLTLISLALDIGMDTVNASTQTNSAVILWVSGFGGDDNITGSPGADSLSGGAGNDTLVGNGGDDFFSWISSDGNDTIDGGAGIDEVDLTNSGANEIVTISRTPAGFTVTRDVGNVTLTVDAVEELTLDMFSGADRVNTVGLPNTTQTLDGGAGTDTLEVNAQGAVVTSSPGTINVAGSQPIHHTNFETVIEAAAAGIPTVNFLGLLALALLTAAVALVTLRT